MGQYDVLLKPLKIRNVVIKNRILSTSHSPGYGEDGKPKARYQLYHEEKAKGGIGLTMFGGSSAVSQDSSVGAWKLLYLGDDSIIPYFREFSERIHRHGARLMCQVSHQGRRNHWDTGDWLPIISASAVPEPQHNHMPKAMEDWDIERVVRDFGQAARRCKEAGLDGIEINAPGPHLISQFLTPSVNKRDDQYGGSLENRLRFAFEVFEEVRRQVGDDFVVGFRMSGDELFEGGLDLRQCLEIGKRIADTKAIDFLTVNGASSRDYNSVALHVPGMALPIAPFLHLASAMKAEVSIPIFHAQRQNDLDTAARAVAEGHVDMVGLTRAHFTDPHIVKKLMEGRVDDIRQCVGAGYCIDRLLKGGDSLCIHNAATSREAIVPHVIRRAATRKRVVIVGAGPGGLEAARASGERGHEVILFERSASPGGQINIASRLAWREALNGITRWLEMRVRKLNIDMRLNTEATPEAITALAPDVVIVATGGRPSPGGMPGAELAVTSWDVLSGKAAPGENILIYDESCTEHGLSCAEFLATRGALVEIVSHERTIGKYVGPTNFPFHLRELHKNKVVFTPDTTITSVYRERNKLIAVLRNEYSSELEEREIDQVVMECGTLPCAELYFALKPHSTNLGELDLVAFAQAKSQSVSKNRDGRFQLFRVGDAVSGRNIHAAIYDSLRLCADM